MSPRSTAVEVDPVELPALVEDHRRQSGGLPAVAGAFQALPDPAGHPAFRITITRNERA